MDEKRKHQRFRQKQQIWCEGQDTKVQVESQDMSRGGIAIITKDAPKIGTQLKVSFVVPDGENVSVNMEVVWSKQRSETGGQVTSGLRVLNFEKGQEAFNEFVANHLTNMKKEDDDEDIEITPPNEEENDSSGG